MPDYDPYSIQLADEPTALEMAKARAAALRGQNYAGMIASLAHDPSLAHTGNAMINQAQTGLQELGATPGERMRQALQGQTLKRQQREDAPYTDPAQAALLSQGQQQAAKMFGGSIPEGASPTTGNMLLQAMEKAAGIPKVAPLPFGTAGLYNVHDASVTPLPANMQGTGGLLSEDALNQQADVYAKTGQLPSMGKANPAIHGAIIQRAAQRSGGADLATTRSSFHADTGSLAKLQTSADSIDAFENTALKNLDQLDIAAKNAMDTGFPILNKPIRSFDNKVLGDPRMAVFNAARQTAVQEVGKVLGGAVSGGAISDSQRHEVEGLLSGDMTLPQIRATIQQLKIDMGNRKASTHAQLGEIRGRLSGKAETPAAPEAGPAAAPTSKPDVRVRLAALKASGASADAVRQALKAEYTPDELKAAAGGR